MTVELISSWSRVGWVAASAVLTLLGLIALVRIIGLRSFSKMSSFDFVVTVALGSLLAATAMSGSSFFDGFVAATTLLALQWIIALGRSRLSLGRFIDNQPLVLMANGSLIHEHLREARVTPDDIWGKLREANALDPADVAAVVLEATGDISVLHGSELVHPDVLSGVRGAELVRSPETPR